MISEKTQPGPSGRRVSLLSTRSLPSSETKISNLISSGCRVIYIASLKGDVRKERQRLEKDAQLAEEFGFKAQFLASVPYFNQPGVRFPNQAKFHPIKYLSALARIIPGQGSFIFENTAAESFDEKPLTVHSGNHKIRCDYVFLATHTPLMGTTGLLSATLFQTKLSLYTSYVLGAKLPSRTSSRSVLLGYWTPVLLLENRSTSRV